MRASRAVFFVAALLLAGPAVAQAQAAPPPPRHPMPSHSQRPVCGTPANATAECNAQVVTQPDGTTPLATANYSYGYRPVDLKTAYGIGAGAGAPTVGIVDAYDNPNAEADLGAYRSQFSLPACTTANGCFKKVNQTGGTSYPGKNVGWGQEIALDVDMVSAVCPNCHILLVEASSNSFDNLMTAVDYATAHAGYVSNSYGGSEFNGETFYDSHFNKPGVAITVSSGDNGYGVEFPAASQYVTAVGGTSLNLDSSGNRSSETVWNGAGSGCSSYEPKPSWQHDANCSRRTVADVSAVADPNTGVAVYDSYGSGGANWMVFGGTSVASPVVASVYAVAGTPAAGDYPSSYPYGAAAGSLFDVTSGNNGSCGNYLCKGTVGYDGPTGLGTPIGTTAFAVPGSPPPPPPPPPGDLPPVIDSTSKSCTNNKCTLTVTAHDPEGATLTYAWSRGTSTTNTDLAKFTKTGSFTVTATVSDGANPVQTSFSVSCTYTSRVVCS